MPQLAHFFLSHNNCSSLLQQDRVRLCSPLQRTTLPDRAWEDLEARLYEWIPLRVVLILTSRRRQVGVEEAGVSLASRLREEVEAGSASGLPEGQA